MKHFSAKTILILCLALMLSALAPLNALSEDGINILVLSSSYLVWADYFGVTYLEEDFSTTRTDDNTSRMTVDNIAVFFDTDTFQFDHALCVYKYPGFTDLEMDLRAIAFFAAAEFGKPDEITTEVVRTVRVASMKILKQMKETIALPENAAALKQGKYIPFHVGQNGIYSFMQSSDGTMQVIILE